MGGGLSGKGSVAAATVSHRDCPSIANTFRGSAPAVRGVVLSAIKKESSRPRAGIALFACARRWRLDRKSTRLNSSHTVISYAVFCLKKKKNKKIVTDYQQ